MKDYYKTAAVFAIIYLSVVLIFAVITGRGGKTGRDIEIIKLNDIVYDSALCWGSLSDLNDTDYGVDFAVLDFDGKVLYASDHARMDYGRLSVETAIKEGYPYRYITVNDKVKGYAVIMDSGNNNIVGLRKRMIAGFAITGFIFLVIAVLFGAYISKSIYMPFRDMKDFAGKVAEGRLDEPLVMDKSNMFGAFTESFDIMREELKESKKREIELQRRERELVASLSHDLKTPITGIKLICEVLKARFSMEEHSPDVEEKIDNIYKKAEQIDVLVNDLFSSTLEDLGEFKVSCTDESSLVLSDIFAHYDDKGLVSMTDIPQAMIHVDKKRLGQVIGNIISNSYKYADTKIEVSFSLIKDYMEMRISDFGPGVPEDEIGLITNKFYRGKQWVKSSEEGSGLGLYIAKILIEKMDGELIPENTGNGLRITLTIPLS